MDIVQDTPKTCKTVEQLSREAVDTIEKIIEEAICVLENDEFMELPSQIRAEKLDVIMNHLDDLDLLCFEVLSIEPEHDIAKQTLNLKSRMVQDLSFLRDA